MSNSLVYPVVAGLAAGIVLIVAFSFYAPSVAPSVINSTPQTSVVIIPNGSSQQSAQIYLIPKTIHVAIGLNNTVKWMNEDNVGDSIVSDTNYVDPVSGNFSTFAQLKSGYILPNQTFSFTFTQPGQYDYHEVPHPFAQGTVIVSTP